MVYDNNNYCSIQLAKSFELGYQYLETHKNIPDIVCGKILSFMTKRD